MGNFCTWFDRQLVPLSLHITGAKIDEQIGPLANWNYFEKRGLFFVCVCIPWTGWTEFVDLAKQVSISHEPAVLLLALGRQDLPQEWWPLATLPATTGTVPNIGKISCLRFSVTHFSVFWKPRCPVFLYHRHLELKSVPSPLKSIQLHP